jgi:effector-binding domain-containing protein
MKKTIVLIISIVCIGAASWYLFVKDHEFSVGYRFKTVPGDIIQTIKIWDRALDYSEVIEVDSLSSLIQIIKWEGRQYTYLWNFQLQNDSITRVRVKISEKGRELQNKILIPFSKQPIEIDAEKIAYQFNDIMTEHLKITSVKVEGMDSLSEYFCICTQLETRQIEKANGMMLTFNYLTSLINKYNLKEAGKPIIDIIDWSHNNDYLKYDFCFPVIPTKNIPQIKDVFFKSIKVDKAIKAVYNGNYITSDRAWYYLYNHAKNKSLKISGLPKEVFYDNPNMGLNEKNWKAEVFLPVQ